ncbi:DUF4349 domain-containing protein [Orlajensenia flava]|nr:DUF4349 domain-containing protein [Glaciibacter flavus]
MKRAVTASSLLLAAAILLAGCSVSGSGSNSSHGPAVETKQGDVGAAAPAADGTAKGDATTLEQRVVVTTGSMTVSSDDPIGAARQAAQLVVAASGRVDSRSESPATDEQAASASVVLRIPADRFDAVVSSLDKLGRVSNFSTDAADVTQQKQDVDARITALDTSVKRLEQLMGSATNTTDLIDIENALSQRQADLDSLTTQRDYLADQVDYSTLTVQFGTGSVALPGAPTTFWGGVLAGWAALGAFIAAALVVAGAVLPWLLAAGVVAAIVLLVIRWARRPRRAGAEDTPA